MDRLTDRLRSLDDVRVPELWPEIERRPPSGHGAGPGRGERTFTVVVALLATVGGLLVAVRAFRGGVTPQQTPTPPVLQRADPVTRAFVLDEERQVSCEVELPSGELMPGEPTLVSFSYRNEADEGEYVLGEGFPHLLITDAEGNFLYETQGFYDPKGHSSSYKVEPGETVTMYAPFTPIWAGPLYMEPDCWGAGDPGDGDRAISTLVANVASPGPPISATEALERAVARTGFLFQSCRPRADGDAVVGTIAPPGPIPDVPAYTYIGGHTATRIPAIDSEKIDLADLEALCVAHLDVNPGFAIVDLWFASPADVPLPPPSWGIADAVRLPQDGHGQVGRWTLMVTAESTRSVSPHGRLADRGRGEQRLMTVFRPPAECEPSDPAAEPPPGSCILISFSFKEGQWTGDAHRAFHSEDTASWPKPLIWFVGRTTSPTPSESP